jgi:hypothetical protein
MILQTREKELLRYSRLEEELIILQNSNFDAPTR